MNTMMMTLLSRESISFVEHITAANQARTTPASLALARVLAFGVELPSMKMEDLLGHYQDHCLPEITAKLNEINELVIVDFQTTLDLAYQFYMSRYYVVFPIDTVAAFNKETAIEDFFGISRGVARATVAQIRNTPDLISRYCLGFSRLSADLNKPTLA